MALVIVVQRQRVLARRIRRLERRQATGLRAPDTRHVVTFPSGFDPEKAARVIDRELARMSRHGG